MKKLPYKVKILGDTEDAIIILQEQEVFSTYRVLSSQIKVEYIEDHEGKTDSIKVDRRMSRNISKNVYCTKGVKCKNKQCNQLKSGLKVGNHQKKADEKCKVKIESQFNVQKGYKSKINEKSKNVNVKKVEMECKHKCKVVQRRVEPKDKKETEIKVEQKEIVQKVKDPKREKNVKADYSKHKLKSTVKTVKKTFTKGKTMELLKQREDKEQSRKTGKLLKANIFLM